MPSFLSSVAAAAPGLFLRVSIVLLIASAVQAVLPKRASAALRHLIWSLAVCAALALPLLAWLGPTWTLEVRRVSGAPAPPLPVAAATDLPAADAVVNSVARDGVDVRAPGSTTPTAAEWAAAAYVMLALLLFARVARQQWAVADLRRTAASVHDANWLAALRACAHDLGVRRDVRLLRTGDAVPMTCGTRRPAVILPEAADGWDDGRRRAVLLHELAHVVRRDCLVQSLAAVACAVYWCHPLMWWVARRLRVERELACDDRVIAAGTPARAYANHLLEIAHAFAVAPVPTHAVSMARPRQLEGRLLALLDASRDRRPIGNGLRAAVAIVTAVVVIPVAALTATVVAVVPDTAARVPSLTTTASADEVDARISPTPAVHEHEHSEEAAQAAAGTTTQTASAARQPGTWEIRPAETAGTVRLRLNEDRSSSSFDVPVDALSGLSATQLASGGGPIKFSLKRDAGTFTFDGVLTQGVGAGTFAFSPDPTFAAGLEKRGYARPSENEQYQLARHDVGFAFVDLLAQQGYTKPQTADLVRAGQHGVQTRYLREMGELGYRVGTLDALITLRDHGVTPSYVRELGELGYKGLSVDDVRTARDHGITPDYVRGMAAAGYTKLPMPELIKARDHGVTPDYVQGMATAGYAKLPLADVINARDHGVNPEYVRGLAEAGHRGLPLEEVIRVRDHGVSAEYVKVMRERGYAVPIAELVKARDHGVSADYLQEMAALGYDKTPLDTLVRMRDHGVSSGYVKELKTLGYERLSPDDLVTLRDHGFTADRIKRINDRSGSRLPVAALLEALK